MYVFRFSSRLSKDKIMKRLQNLKTMNKNINAIAVSSNYIHSLKQLQLAYILTKKSFKRKTNLANDFILELLLWLLGETDIRKALAKNDFSPDNFILVSFQKINRGMHNMLLKKLCAKEKSIMLKKNASALELEKISTSRL
ncbi:MAG: KEOPS complex subunit Cgi121 [Candidatus Micrarchaeota archaeon]